MPQKTPVDTQRTIRERNAATIWQPAHGGLRTFDQLS